jgi:ABC-type transport system involved in multi-copper enzyme maturation permease subunit
MTAAVPAARWLVRDTFRQSLASGIFWLMLAVSAATAGICLTVQVAADAPPLTPPSPPSVGGEGGVRGAAARTARVELLSGAITLDVPNPRADPVRTLQLQLAGWVADAAGLILALIWTAGFLPSFLDPGAVPVLLAKPVPRWSLVAGKFAGVLVFVAFQTTVFVTLTWLALAVRTGVWDGHYLLCIPLLILSFAVFYSFSAMLAVATRSTVACAFGSIGFWLVCWAVNFARDARALITDLKGVAPTFGRVLEAGYWLLPKPLDFHLMLMRTLDAENLFARTLDVGELMQKGLWHPAASVATSLAFGAAMLILAAYEFMTKDF